MYEAANQQALKLTQTHKRRTMPQRTPSDTSRVNTHTNTHTHTHKLQSESLGLNPTPSGFIPSPETRQKLPERIFVLPGAHYFYISSTSPWSQHLTAAWDQDAARILRLSADNFEEAGVRRFVHAAGRSRRPAQGPGPPAPITNTGAGSQFPARRGHLWLQNRLLRQQRGII